MNFPDGKDFSVLMQEVGSSSLLKYISGILRETANSVPYIAIACEAPRPVPSQGRLLGFRPFNPRSSPLPIL